MSYRKERFEKLFDKYADSIKSKRTKLCFPGNSKRDDKRIRKYIKYFCLPVKTEEVIAFMDTTVFRTGKEGILFTVHGIVTKEVINKLYYLNFSKLDRAEIEEITDEYYNTTSTLWVYSADGSRRKIFDFYVKKYFFAEYINEAIALTRECDHIEGVRSKEAGVQDSNGGGE